MMLPVKIRRVGPIDLRIVDEIANAYAQNDWASDQYERTNKAYFGEGRIILYASLGKYAAAIPRPIRDVFSAISNHYPNTVVFRAEASYLGAGKKVVPHTDGFLYHTFCHRVHVPITTNPQAWMQFGDEEHHLPVGNIYEMNNRVHHGVSNDGPDGRIHLIVDMIPVEKMAEHIEKLDALFEYHVPGGHH